MKITPREKRPHVFFSLPATCRLFLRGVIFTRVRVSLSLLSLRKNGGLLVVYNYGTRFETLGSLSSDVFERRASTGSGVFALFGSDFEQRLEKIVSLRVKSLSNTNLVASWHIKREKVSLPVDLRRSKTSLVKLPSGCQRLSMRSFRFRLRHSWVRPFAEDVTACVCRANPEAGRSHALRELKPNPR